MINEINIDHPTASNNAKRKPILIKPAKWVFYTVFTFAFVLSGVITMANVLPYRMGLVSLLVLPLFFLYGLKIDLVFILYVLLGTVVAISAVYNGSSFAQFALFLRILVFSYLIYYLVEVFVKKNNIASIMKLVTLVGMLQLPIVAVQTLTYNWLPASITIGMNLAEIDYDFGTFNFKGDYSMTFFLILLVAFLLFDKKRNYVIPHRLFVIGWLTATVLITNADIAKGALAIVWGVYFITHLNRRIGIYLLFFSIAIIGIMMASKVWSTIWEDLSYKVVSETQSLLNGDKVDVYLQGGYARGAAIYYFLNNDLLLVGDGPSKYIDPITKEQTRGNVGHIFTFYSEVGLLGWLISMMVFFQIAFTLSRGHIRITWTILIMFVLVFIMSFTSQIMNDISVMLIYCLIAKITLITPIERVTLTA